MKALGEILRRFGLLFAAGALLFAFVWASWKVQTTYDVAVHTEFVKVETPDHTDLLWALPPLEMPAVENPPGTGAPTGEPPLAAPHEDGWKGIAHIFDFQTGAEYQDFAGHFHLREACDVEVQRILGGRLRISLESRSGQGLGWLKTYDEEVVELGAEVVLEFPGLATYLERNQTLILPLSGDIFVGQEIGEGGEPSNPILLSGTLALVDYSDFGERFFRIDSFDLGPGDWLTVERLAGETASSRGFVRIDQDPAMQVVFRTVAWRAKIQRYGGRPFTISAGLRDTFFNNPYVNTASSSFMAILLFLGGWLAAKKD